uniref:Uncharacterized protein n=1 Tax=Oryza sativa subsp. japonica TaxID=39947 RepID=Q69VP6_ORYSJ|nr:hypothetical protein [Oryza sativa Japonica Group]
MAAAGMGGDGNNVPTTPGHNGAAAEGRQDLDFGKAAPVGFWTEWSGSQGAVERGDAARRRLERREAAAGGGIVEVARVDSGGGILVGDLGKRGVERGNGAVDGVRTAAAMPGRATAQCGVNESGGAARLEGGGIEPERGGNWPATWEEREVREAATWPDFAGRGGETARTWAMTASTHAQERESRGRGGDVGGCGGHGGGWGWS